MLPKSGNKLKYSSYEGKKFFLKKCKDMAENSMKEVSGSYREFG